MVIRVSDAKMDELMPCRVLTRIGPRNHVSHGVHMGATWWMQLIKMIVMLAVATITLATCLNSFSTRLVSNKVIKHSTMPWTWNIWHLFDCGGQWSYLLCHFDGECNLLCIIVISILLWPRVFGYKQLVNLSCWRPHTHIHFMALWTLSRITWVSRYQNQSGFY